jgi:hypothetical protein
MSLLKHKYFCWHCSISMCGETPVVLAGVVNTHNARIHPLDFAKWNSQSITQSSQYDFEPSDDKDSIMGRLKAAISNPSDNRVHKDGKPLPQYTKPHGTTSKNEWGDAKSPPQITAEDRQLLALGKVKW